MSLSGQEKIFENTATVLDILTVNQEPPEESLEEPSETSDELEEEFEKKSSEEETFSEPVSQHSHFSAPLDSKIDRYLSKKAKE